MKDLSLGEKITLLRNRKQYSKKALADVTGIHWSNISKYEHNRSTPTLDVLKKIAVALEASLDYMLLNKELIDVDDRDLLGLLSKVDKMPEKEKNRLKKLITSYVETQK